MARILTCGFEINDTSGAEFMNAGGGAVAYAAVARSGDRSLRINGMTSGAVSGVVGRFAVTAADGPYYARFAFRVDTAPTAANSFCGFSTSTNLGLGFSNRPHIRLNSDRTLAAWVDGAQLGSASPALTLGKWHEIHVWWDCSPAVGSRVYRCYLDGVEWAGTSTSSMTAVAVALSFQVGGNLLNETQTQGDWFFDDWAINDDTGSDQNGLPPSGRVVCMFPDSAGDSNGWNNTANAAGSSNNYTLVDENPPDDGSSLVQSNTLNAADLYNLESSGLGTDDTINCVQVYDRHRNNTTDAATSYALQIEKTSGGTKTQGATVTPNSTTWRTGSGSGSTVAPWASLTVYTDPDGAAWTTSTVNTMQVGPKLTATGTNRCQVSTVWATVDYTPAPARRWYLANEAADYTPATKRGAWDDSAATLARKLSYTPSGAATTAAVAETSSTGDWDVLVGRWVSDGATVAGTLSGYINWVIGAGESDAAANMVWHAHVYVTSGDTDTPRGTLRADYVGSAEWPTTASGRSAVNISVTSTAISVGDRIVLELGYRAQNTATTSYTGTIHYGNTGVADLRSTATTVTVDPGWVEIVGAQDIWDPDVVPGGTVEGDGTSTGTATTTGSATRTRNASATATGTAATTGAASATRAGSASATRTAATSATAAVTRNAAGTGATTAATTSTATPTRNAAGTASATAATTATAVVTRGATATSTTAADTDATAHATRGATATATTTAATTAAGTRARNASGTATATASTSGAATRTRNADGTAGAVAATTGSATAGRAASGAASAAAATTGSATVTRNAAGTAATTAATTGSASTTGDPASGTSTALAGTTGNAAVTRNATTAAGTSAATVGAGVRTRNAAGLSAKVAATSGAATLTVHAAGASTTTAGTVGAANTTGQGGAAVTAATTASAQVTRRGAATGARVAASTATAQATYAATATATAVAGTVGVGVVVAGVIYRPDTGTVARPSSGTITRPNAGTIYQP